MLDAPATGHGLTLLTVPDVFLSIVSEGPLARDMRDMQALLKDPARCRTCVVTLPEEMPVNEAIELHRALDANGLPQGALFLNAVFAPRFSAQERVQALLPLGSVRYVSGKIEIWDGYRQMVHPDRILDERRIGELPAVEAVYGLTEGLSTRLVGKFVGTALERLPAMPEWQVYAPEFPQWYVWRGVAGHYYARVPRSSPPRVVRALNPEDLREEIARAENSRRLLLSGSRFRNHCA